jgi:hypothetical protein
MKKENLDRLDFLKGSANEAKDILMEIEKLVEEICPVKAEKLSAIIWKLEAWQNSR